uniref:Small ribosomal subunit protein uS15 n=1 Tax=uncultured Mycoplasmataceae bacterium TaxID=300027 RepID=A0A6G9HGY6_9MOLU|nr:30S ribosomal protein S15 [uncultured Mycoplasmataceae bacterium]
MAVTTKAKKEAIKKFGGSELNTGSVQTQVALLTLEINELTKHLVKNPKDNSSKRGLFQKVSKRKSLLRYLENKDIEAYRKLVKELNLRN